MAKVWRGGEYAEDALRNVLLAAARCERTPECSMRHRGLADEAITF